MALDPQLFIENQKSLANSYIDNAENFANDLVKGYTGAYIESDNTDTTYRFNAKNLDFPIDLSKYPFNTYTAPAQDITPSPVYVAPSQSVPTLAALVDVPSITNPVFPLSPADKVSSAISGLFQEAMPSMNMPSWNVATPDTQADKLVAEMDALAMPQIMQIDFPEITQLILGKVPDIILPSYDAPIAPNNLNDPVDYATVFKTAYDNLSISGQAFINDQVEIWIGKYAPEYQAVTAQLAQKIADGLSGAILPNQIESAMMIRARSRIEQDYQASELTIETQFEKNGFIQPPGRKMSALLVNRWNGNNSLANQSTDIYIERLKIEVQNMQFVMGLADKNVQSIRGFALQWAQSVIQNMQTALSLATQIGEMTIKIYEHLIAKANLTLAIMAELRQQYEVRLKVALSALESYKLELEAARLQKDVELAQVQVIGERVKAQELLVSQYSAIIDAISRKANIEELKLKTYSTQAMIFDTQIKAQIANFDVYKAALQGDEAKLNGQLGLIKIYDSQLQAVNTQLEANIKTTEVAIETNNAKVKVFEAQSEVFKLNLETALKTFSVGAEVKKLAQEIYKTQIDASVQTFGASLETQKLYMGTILNQYNAFLKNYEINTSMKMNLIQSNLSAAKDKAGIYSQNAQSLASSNISLASSIITGS